MLEQLNSAFQSLEKVKQQLFLGICLRFPDNYAILQVMKGVLSGQSPESKYIVDMDTAMSKTPMPQPHGSGSEGRQSSPQGKSECEHLWTTDHGVQTLTIAASLSQMFTA